jgi:hypothetical protein
MRRARTASGGSEEAARDTSRPRTDDLEDGVPLPLLKHGIEVLRALATAAASTAERRVARKDINSKPPHGSWQALFDASKPSSLVARGYAAKGYGAGPDYGRYWITAAGLEYLAAVDRAAVADADAPVPAPPLRLDADEDLDEDDAPAPVPAAAPARVHAARAARLSKELGTARRSASSARASMAASTSSSHVWKLARREGMPPFDSENPFDDGDVDDSSSDFDSEGSDDDDSDDDDSGGNSRSTQARNVVCRLAVYTGGSGRSKLGWSGRRASRSTTRETRRCPPTRPGRACRRPLPPSTDASSCCPRPRTPRPSPRATGDSALAVVSRPARPAPRSTSRRSFSRNS